MKRARSAALFSRGSPLRWVSAGAVSLVFWFLLQTLVPGRDLEWTPTMFDAARRMERALEITAAHCRVAGIDMNEATDPNRTCLIGPEMSELFTTAGQLLAKRTTTNPDVAGLVVHLLAAAGVAEGDRVAVAASGSFPGLMVASLVAIEAIGAAPVSVLSPGASSWGATRPEFDLLDLHQLLRDGGVLRTSVAAASLGGSRDTGGEFEPEVRERLARKIRDLGIPYVHEPDLATNVAERMRIYAGAVAFVNIGGSEASIGTSPRILEVPAGLSTNLAERITPPPADQRGVLFEMAAAGVPVLHLLHVRGLALQYGMPWDPVPLPAAGTTRLRESVPARGPAFWFLSAAWLAGLAAAWAVPRRKAPDVAHP